MAIWTARTHVAAIPDEVLALLTEPDAIARWAPVEFELADFEGERLLGGDQLRVQGCLAGRNVQFDVAVAQAQDGHLLLTADGPVRLEVEYLVVAVEDGSEVRASIAVSGSGLIGRILAQATDAVLAAGALNTAVGRIARELEPALAA